MHVLLVGLTSFEVPPYTEVDYTFIESYSFSKTTKSFKVGCIQVITRVLSVE